MAKSQHWDDTVHPTKSGHRQRIISNWRNFRTPASGWAKANAKAITAAGKPPDWAGTFDFSFTSLDAPLQIFARDAMDVGNRAMVGVRRSDSPSSWLNMKALNVNAVDAVVSADGLTITYPGLWAGCDLIYTIMKHKLKETVRIWDSIIAPAYFEWTMKTGPGYTLDITNNVMFLRDGNGDATIESKPPWGEDSATMGSRPGGRQQIRCSLIEQSSYMGLPVIRLTPNPDDMATAVGVVELDPDLNISGTTAIDDSSIFTSRADNNFGSKTAILHDSNAIYRGLIRINDGQLPVGNYSVATFSATHFTSRIFSFYRILPANAGWGEGNKDDSAADTGEVTWNNARHGEQAWAGSGGCSTAETDHTLTDKVINMTGAGPWAISTSWFDGWSQGTFANAGILIWAQTSTLDFINSTENASGNPEFDLTYEPAGDAITYFFMPGI